jgi:hypothetical protein
MATTDAALSVAISRSAVSQAANELYEQAKVDNVRFYRDSYVIRACDQRTHVSIVSESQATAGPTADGACPPSFQTRGGIHHLIVKQWSAERRHSQCVAT